METGTPDLGLAREFATELHKEFPGKLLAYNCSPSFNWKRSWPTREIATFQDELGELGYASSSSPWPASTPSTTRCSTWPRATPRAA